MQIPRPPELENMPEFLFDYNIILTDPRDENCYETIKGYCCPNFKLTSFTAIISLIEITIFILMCIYGEFNSNSVDVMQFSDQTLYMFGRCQAYEIKYKLEYYRIFTTLFLFNNIKELCGGLLFQILIGSLAERFNNQLKTGLIYFCSGIAGILSFIVFYDQNPMGNIFSMFGLLGAIFGFAIQSAQQGDEARQIIIQVAIVVFVIGMIGLFYRQSLIMGYFGSFIVGITMGLISPIHNRIMQRTKLKFVGISVIFMYFTGFTYIFFGYRQPTREKY